MAKIIKATANCDNSIARIEASSFTGLKRAATLAFNDSYFKRHKITISINGVKRFVKESRRFTGDRGRYWKEV